MFLNLFNNSSLKYIRSTWGSQVKKKRNFETMNSFKENNEKSIIAVDNFTWSDLNMNEVFNKLDRTLSTAGEYILYNILRNPLTDNTILKTRGKTIDFFEKNKDTREQLQLLLFKLGITNSDINSVLFKKLTHNKIYKILCNLMPIILLCIIVSLAIFRNKNIGGLLILSSFFNMFLHYKMDREIKEQALSAGYLGKLVIASKKISKLNIPELKEYLDKIKLLEKNCSKIGAKSSIISKVDGLDVLGDYINILLLVKERNYFSLIDIIERNKKDLLELFILVGELDAFISVASYKTELKNCIEPELTANLKYLKVENIIHPLVKEAVPNSISIDNKGIIITGSNMAGKSTFLRTITINAIFAQTIYTVLATSYSSSFFHIITSIEPEDNIIEGTSYYLGEAESLLRIIRATNNNIPCLAAIDEIFRGTNPIERINASAEVLNYLDNHNTLALVATHDLVLTNLVNNFDCYYFREQVTNDKLTFDYLIKKGISPTRNAIRLLKYLGYPKDIIENTEKRIAQEEDNR